MSPRLPRVSGEDFLRFLEDRGFAVVRVKGSRHVLRNAVGKMVVVLFMEAKLWGLAL